MGKVVAAIPAYNEEVAIGSAVIKAREHVDEVIVIDDGSSDATAKIAALAGAHVICHGRNLGKGAAVRTALDYALDDGVEILVFHDGDMQHDPADIPKVVLPILEGKADIVIGTRREVIGRMPLYRRFGKRLLDRATAVAANGSVVVDSQNGFRAYRRGALARLRPSGNGISVESEMLVKANQLGLTVVEVPVSVRYDVEGSTLNPIRHGLSVLAELYTLIAERRPLFYFGFTGLALIVIGTGLGFHVLQVFYATHMLAIGYTIIVAILLIVGIVSIFTGVMLHALQRMIKHGALGLSSS